MSQPTAQPETKTSVSEANGRDANGRFTRGNKGGPGNPFGRRLAQMRQVVAEAVSEQDLRAIVAVLVAKAKEGDVPAIKLLLQYVVGKPQPAADPDRVDVEEWQLAEASSVASARVEEVALHSTPVQVATTFAEVMAPVKVAQMQGMMAQDEAKNMKRAAPEAVEEEEIEREMEELLGGAPDDLQLEQLLGALAQGVGSWEELIGAVSSRNGNGTASGPERRAAPSPNGENGGQTDRKRRTGLNGTS